MGSEFKHTSVLLQKAVDFLEVKPNFWYVDATAGGGGHTQEILERGGRVVCIDQDEDAIAHLKKRFSGEENVRISIGNFNRLQEICRSYDIRPFGVLFDLGVSSYQIDASERGFSFQRNEDLNMKMHKEGTLDAKTIVNNYSFEDLHEIFTKFGEEPYAEQIARAILGARRVNRIETTGELVEIVKSVSGEKRIHPATRVFQALRIEANKELDVLEEGLREGFEIVQKNGRLVVISFHSLEDRIVKRFFENKSENNMGRIISKKPITADWKETKKNVRSRSAKMRALEKL